MASCSARSIPRAEQEHTVLGHRVDECEDDNTPAKAMEAMAMIATKEASNTTVVPATESAKTVMGFSTAWLSTMNQSVPSRRP